MKKKPTPTTHDVSRRNFMQKASSAIAIGTAATTSGLLSPDITNAQDRGGLGGNSARLRQSREKEAAAIRNSAASRQFEYSISIGPQVTCGDDRRYRNSKYYGCFTKTLPHNDLGEVEPSAYEALIQATKTGEPADFDAIPLDPTAARALANPQGAYRFIYSGLDGHSTRMSPAPTFRSAETAAEMGELYWLALTRDVPFESYGSDSTIQSALIDLNRFSKTVGPTVNGIVTSDVLFRGSTPGDLVGPYISQFLWKTVPYGPATIVQQYAIPQQLDDFMTTNGEWLHIQRGGVPTQSQTFLTDRRYIYNNRSLGEYVHGDVLFQAYFNAMLISLTYGGDAISPGNPYGLSITNQGGFTSLGGPWFIDLLTQAGNLALQGAWYQKWIAHRRLRPETFGGRLHNHITGLAEYEIHEDILNSAALNEINGDYGTYFLPMAYPEGSPTHPAYPAGHATVAGACATVLKAVFDENFVIPDPVISTNGMSLTSYNGDTLTLGGEFNKLASNIALGRDAAGVHYRSDGIEGLKVGEQQAIALLQDYSAALNEEFGGFQFTKFDGTQITIVGGNAT